MSHGIVTSGDDPTERFEILAKLGEGSYGSVFKALDKKDGMIVAIKVLEVENDDIAELQKEINILKDCHSPFIVAYKGAFEKDNNIWIVMEYCGAGSVCDLMAICEKTLNEEQIATVMRMALHGLEYLHEHKKIHRDIKSGNILLNHEGDCKLADFGVSAELTTTMAKRKTVIGTPYWMAPEVLQSTEYNGKADIWSLAITAIELAVGEPPHSNVHPMRAIFMIPTSEPPTLPDPSKWSKDFNDFLKICLVKDPEKRPTATWLIHNHPFITKAKGKEVIASLVKECMKEIDEYREQEAKEAEKDADNEGGSATFGTGDINTLGTSTMVGGTVGGTGTVSGTIERNVGTQVLHSGTVDTSKGTYVFSSGGTMVQKSQKDDMGSGTTHFTGQQNNNQGTMVYNSGTMELKGGGTIKARKDSTKVSGTLFSGSGTMVARGKDSNDGATSFMQYYRTGQSLDVDQNSSLLDLRMSLISLNKAYEDEMTALEQFYSKRRQQLKDMIAQKEREALQAT